MKLSTVFELEEKICAARAELERLKTLATATTPKLDGLPKAKSVTSRVENLAVKILDYERRIDGLVEESLCARVDLTIEISARVSGNAGNVMILRYVNCKPFGEIAAALNYSESTIYKLHRQGVSLFKAGDA